MTAPASAWCDRHRGWVDEGRTRLRQNGQHWCEGCIEARAPKPLGTYPARCAATDPRYSIRCALGEEHPGDHQGRGGPVWANTADAAHWRRS